MTSGDCECCGEQKLLPYLHSGRDGRPDVEYCQDCYDAGCDLIDCELPRLRKRLRRERAHCIECGNQVPLGNDGGFVSHDINALQRAVCPGSHTFPVAPVSADELEAALASIKAAMPDSEEQT